VLLVALATMIAGCGGGGGDGDTSSSSSVALEWDAVNHSDLSGYRIYVGIAPGVYLQPPGSGLDVGNVTTYTVTGLASGTQLYFAVTAYDSSSNETEYSNEISMVLP